MAHPRREAQGPCNEGSGQGHAKKEVNRSSAPASRIGTEVPGKERGEQRAPCNEGSRQTEAEVIF